MSIPATISVLDFTVTANGPIAERRAVGFDDAQAGADAPVQGISRTAAADGAPLALTLIGVVDMVAGAPIAKEAKVITDANGLPVPIGAGTNPFGTALTTATNAGDTVRILVR